MSAKYDFSVDIYLILFSINHQYLTFDDHLGQSLHNESKDHLKKYVLKFIT